MGSREATGAAGEGAAVADKGAADGAACKGIGAPAGERAGAPAPPTGSTQQQAITSTNTISVRMVKLEKTRGDGLINIPGTSIVIQTPSNPID